MKENIIFQITEQDLQNEALERIGRQLTDDEIKIAKEYIEWGIADATLNITYHTIFTEMIENEHDK
jgi:hypothetical protein